MIHPLTGTYVSSRILYEQLILVRFKDEINRPGDFFEGQYGFGRAKRTVDAISEYVKIAQDAVNSPRNEGRLCFIITLERPETTLVNTTISVISYGLRNKKIIPAVGKTRQFF